MKKNKVYITIFIIFVMAFFAGNLDYPQFLNLNYLPAKDFKLKIES